jgi:Mg/Co/Ni transporter MgtE
VLSVLPVTDKEAILHALDSLDKVHTEKIRSILEQHDQSILNHSTRDFVEVGPDEAVNEVQEKYHIIAKGKKVVMYIYVVDEHGRLLGVVDIKELLEANPEAKLKQIMIRNVMALKPESTLKDASLIFSKYQFRAIPIVDEDNKLVGVVPYRDVMNIEHIFFD